MEYKCNILPPLEPGKDPFFPQGPQGEPGPREKQGQGAGPDQRVSAGQEACKALRASPAPKARWARQAPGANPGPKAQKVRWARQALRAAARRELRRTGACITQIRSSCYLKKSASLSAYGLTGRCRYEM